MEIIRYILRLVGKQFIVYHLRKWNYSFVVVVYTTFDVLVIYNLFLVVFRVLYCLTGFACFCESKRKGLWRPRSKNHDTLIITRTKSSSETGFLYKTGVTQLMNNCAVTTTVEQGNTWNHLMANLIVIPWKLFKHEAIL